TWVYQMSVDGIRFPLGYCSRYLRCWGRQGGRHDGDRDAQYGARAGDGGNVEGAAGPFGALGHDDQAVVAVATAFGVHHLLVRDGEPVAVVRHGESAPPFVHR